MNETGCDNLRQSRDNRDLSPRQKMAVSATTATDSLRSVACRSRHAPTVDSLVIGEEKTYPVVGTTVTPGICGSFRRTCRAATLSLEASPPNMKRKNGNPVFPEFTVVTVRGS